MPEGHTLHRLAQALDAAYAGTTPSVSSPQGRFVEGAALLDGREVAGASAWGKHLFMEFAGDRWLNVHLGLIGKFSVDQISGYAVVPPPWGAVRLRMVNDDYLADLRGATLVAVVSPEEVEATVARLGPDPLRTDMPQSDPDRAWARIAKSGRTCAELLMDQSVLAGVGNVYRCEVLFRHRVNPFRPGKEIRKSTWQAIWDDLVRLMPLGVTFNQILTMEDQVEQATALAAAGRIPQLTSTWTDSARRTTPGPAGVVAAPVVDGQELADIEDTEEDEGGVVGAKFAGMPRRYYVYRRQGERCRVCGSRVRTKVVAGRNLFWCGNCQRRR
ncbi:DNA-formamidopyrimidine glycosylase family protein [Lapillicoccus sp.]|uniref:Fpg/Nei family DNA glycosylase n=1 Tax=Lapillicoccus sp. TaxID=1909287 RepID=UPI003265E545